MPPPLLSTRMIKSILHHTLCLGHSQRHCAQALGVSKGVVAKYLAAAAAAGLDRAAIEPLTEAELEQCLFPAWAGVAATVIPDYAVIHQELSRKGITLMLLRPIGHRGWPVPGGAQWRDRRGRVQQEHFHRKALPA